MCSLIDDEGSCGHFIYSEKSPSCDWAKCRRCPNKSLVVLQKKDAYCKECFVSAATHKFRSALGKTKMMKPSDRVLVTYSGGQSSTALLHLLNRGASEKHHKKILFNVSVLFIEEGILFGMNNDDRISLVDAIKKNVEPYGFPLYVLSLGKYSSDVANINSSLKICPNEDEELVKLFNSIKTLTSKMDLLNVLRNKLINKAAVELKCNKIFTAEVGNNLAIKLLNNISLGRGNQAAHDSGFCDSRNPQCQILRPLRDFLKKEIVFYNKFFDLKPLSIQTFSTMCQTNACIQKCTEKFVTDLQEEFPSTIYTIFRTGEKLSSNDFRSSSDEIDQNCLICGHEIKVNNKTDYCAADVLNHSKGNLGDKKQHCNEGHCSAFCSNRNDLYGHQNYLLIFGKTVCFGCREIINDMDNLDCFGDLIASNFKHKNLEQMKDQISEYLLDGT